MFRPIFVSFRLLTTRQKVIFLTLVVTRVANNLLDVVALMAVGLLGSMLAAGLADESEASFAGYSINVESGFAFVGVVTAIALFFLTKSFLAVLLLRITALFLAYVEAEASSDIANYFFSGDLARVQDYSRGDIQFAVGSSTNTAMNGLLLTGSAMVTDAALFVSVLAVFVIVDSSTAVVVAAYFLLIVAFFQFVIRKRLTKLGKDLKVNSVGATNAIYDFLLAFREITVLSRRPFFVGEFNRFRKRQSVISARLNFFYALPRFLLETALMVGVLALVGWQVVRGDLSDGAVTTGVFLAGGLRMTAALLPIQSAFSKLRAFGPQAEMAQDLLRKVREKQSQDIESNAETIPIEAKPSEREQLGCAVSVSDVVFTHHDGDAPAINGVSLDIPAGGYVAFVGPSGAGKTTLADLILGIHTPDSGHVTVDGKPPGTIRREFPGQISYVPQTPGMVSGTIAQNVALGLPNEEIDEERVWQVLAMAELDKAVAGFPDGINSSLGKQSDALSGGQKQRLGLARALYTMPRLLVLDEATSALDAGTEASIATTIEKLGDSVTVIVIAHRLSTIQHADTVFVVEEGGISAQGKFADVRKAVPLIEEYVRLMSFD